MIGTRLAARGALTVLVALLSSCMSLSDPMHHEDSFTESMRTFTQYVRWGNFSGAAAYVTEEQQDEFIELAPQISDVRFTDYEILRNDLNDERTEATVDVVFTGYRLSSPISRTMRLRQVWKRTGSSEWRVTVELGAMRKALGLAVK